MDKNHQEFITMSTNNVLPTKCVYTVQWLMIIISTFTKDESKQVTTTYVLNTDLRPFSKSKLELNSKKVERENFSSEFLFCPYSQISSTQV